jgi:hypothetical protein
MGHVLKCSGLLCMKASRVRVSQNSLKTGGGVVRMVHVALLWRLCRDQIKNRWVDAMGYVRPCYPYFVVFFVLEHRDNLVF